ncbi:hypothetical protein [Pseudoalteromonas aurantia]|uniref:Uncharacterized protein n=1 Tax=Pseudoalteromonas aurantia TaxID=43654 RepID=A0A5S3V6Q2_9GAMM|nr:hypothetical protein [Pseudoalteromonas aurantia]TMO59225.1 hypothetical protein CWC18_16360 [Pseudoalteromonas aurantia]TMO67029.1 hypothetical protein CWC19_14960 [Pseudoalteromonas aurantia]TMO69715.1 hypothetical protein CWC20_20435 [Pseudoalteromonas aurantia]
MDIPQDKPWLSHFSGKFIGVMALLILALVSYFIWQRLVTPPHTPLAKHTQVIEFTLLEDRVAAFGVLKPHRTASLISLVEGRILSVQGPC